VPGQVFSTNHPLSQVNRDRLSSVALETIDLSLNDIPKMCYMIVQYKEYGCGHRYPTRRQKIDCNSKKCRPSQEHAKEPHDCVVQCTQKMMEDQGLIMDVQTTLCDSCV